MRGEYSVRIDTAIKKLTVEYEKATKLDFVRNPVAYALYKVWKMADEDTEGKEDDVEDDLVSRREILGNLMKQPKLTRSIIRRVVIQTRSASKEISHDQEV